MYRHMVELHVIIFVTCMNFAGTSWGIRKWSCTKRNNKTTVNCCCCGRKEKYWSILQYNIDVWVSCLLSSVIRLQYVKYLGVESLVNRFNHISWVTAVTPTDRPKSVRNRCVIKVFGGVFYVVTLLFGFFCECRGFCHRTESDLFPFLLILLSILQLRKSYPNLPASDVPKYLTCTKIAPSHAGLQLSTLLTHRLLSFNL